MTYKKLHICLFFLLCALSSFSQQQWYFWIDEFYPAERNFLQKLSRVMLVNNTVAQPNDFGHSVAMDGVVLHKEEVALSEAALHCLFTATQTMDERMIFDRVELLEYSQNTSGMFYLRHQMSTEEKQRLCNEYDVDALIILNQLVLYNTLESFPADDMYMATLQACAGAHWSVYVKARGNEYSFATSDTLYWESDYAYRRQEALGQLPSTQEALLYLACEVGANVANSLLPRWKSAKRYIYELKELQSGLDAFRYQHWNEAISLWLPCVDGNNKKAAACAASNIAIAYELSGDYALACDYAQRAIRLFGAWKTAYGRQQQANIRYYLAQLQARQARERGL